MNKLELEFFRNKQRALASIASQFFIAGNTLEEAFKKADYMLCKSEEYLDNKNYNEADLYIARKLNEPKFTVEEALKKLGYKSKAMIFRYLDKSLTKNELRELKLKARTNKKNKDENKIVFSQCHIDEIISLRTSGYKRRGP
jgi:SHS2 domain-containing protein